MNKKGFTLIELLAVIVVLAIILVISVPKVSSLITNARQGAFRATNEMIESEIRRVNNLEITPQVYSFNDGVMSPNIGITGDLPDAGTIEINSNGKIQILTTDDDYCAIKRFDEDRIAVYDLGDTKCNLTQEIAITINPNGGEYKESTENLTYQILPNGSLILDTPIKDDNIFSGWDVNCDSCLVDDVYTVGNTSDTITATWQLQSSSYTYTGNSTLVEDSPGNWKLKFLTSGTFTPKVNMEIDAFLVGGGGGGYSDSGGNYDSIGGGGGYANTYKIIKLIANTNYNIVIGEGGPVSYLTTATVGGTTSAFGYISLGGNSGGYISGSSYLSGNGNGGSGGGRYGGAAGSDGSNGVKTDYMTFSIGQGSTTREFGESTGTLYSGGGAHGYGGVAGAGGGGATGIAGTPNTGGGGGSNYRKAGGIGGSGIVVIRKSEPVTCIGNTSKYCFKYGGKFTVVDGNTDDWKIKFLTSGNFIPYTNSDIDAFLVGGGGAGTFNFADCYDTVGGGGGYTTNVKIKSLTAKTNYPIEIGIGGKIKYIVQAGNGENTTAFGGIAAGGIGGGCKLGGNGGSGGGYSSGNGGSDGNDGGTTNGTYGIGQGGTTREFGELTGTLYAGGGGGGYFSTSTLGGEGGGGGRGVSGTPNTGGGGGSNMNRVISGFGGSGIVVIRPAKTIEWICIGDKNRYCFNYSGTYSIENETTDNWKIKLLSSGTFIPNSTDKIDAFLVGGGGGGGSEAGGGGGGGYTKTGLDISLTNKNSYPILVGAGGKKGVSDSNGYNGKPTTAFGYSAAGGLYGSGWSSATRAKGGDGGSGGGGGSNGSAGGAGGNNGVSGTAGITGTYGTGQGTTTREFGEATGILYGSGGGGGNNGLGSNGASSGGNYAASSNATANTGGGGGGGGSGGIHAGGDGGSGIVVIRPS